MDWLITFAMLVSAIGNLSVFAMTTITGGLITTALIVLGIGSLSVFGIAALVWRQGSRVSPRGQAPGYGGPKVGPKQAMTGGYPAE